MGYGDLFLSCSRVATILQKINPQWDGERLFHETRKIVGAEVQAINYYEYLPKILGSSMSAVLGNYTKYDPDVDPTIANSFTASAFRFGHGMLQVCDHK
jgi:peroxidase